MRGVTTSHEDVFGVENEGDPRMTTVQEIVARDLPPSHPVATMNDRHIVQAAQRGSPMGAG